MCSVTGHLSTLLAESAAEGVPGTFLAGVELLGLGQLSPSAVCSAGPCGPPPAGQAQPEHLILPCVLSQEEEERRHQELLQKRKEEEQERLRKAAEARRLAEQREQERRREQERLQAER